MPKPTDHIDVDHVLREIKGVLHQNNQLDADTCEVLRLAANTIRHMREKLQAIYTIAVEQR